MNEGAVNYLEETDDSDAKRQEMKKKEIIN
jgi:hypothetical protein